MPPQPFSARLHEAGTTIRSPRVAWRGPRPGRLGVLAVVVVLGLLAVVYLTFRLTPLSTVQQVTVVGAEGPNAAQIRHTIEQAALGQSTLGFHDGAVDQAVRSTESITGLTVHTRFPHAVQIEVHQRLAVGAIETGGKTVAVSADGRLLPDWAPGTLPVIRDGRAADGQLVGGARTAATILGIAPAALLAKVARVDDGTIVRLAQGPALLFRDTRRMHAKWAAAVAVLSDPATRGATWIDLRVPDQPVSGRGAPPVLPAANARVGRIPDSTDALATAEGVAAGDADTSAGDDTAALAAAPTTTPVTPVKTTPSTAAPTTPATGTASAASGTTTNSAVASAPEATNATAQTGGTTGAATARTAQTTP